MRKRLFHVLAALALTVGLMAPASPAAAADSYVTLFTGDGFTGATCTVFTWDASFVNGIGGSAVGGQCGQNFNNTVESLLFHFHSTSVCWKFYEGTQYGAPAHNFHDQFEGNWELPGNEDNLFSAISKGTQGAGGACIAQHP